MEKVSLVAVLADLRRELHEANEAGKKEKLKLEITSIDVEFAVEITKSSETSGKLNFNVVIMQGSANHGDDLSHTSTHRIKMNLKPSMDGATIQLAAHNPSGG